ncbi:MAG: site-2 protease family protein [Acidimicrobiales bacterium]
MGSEIPLGRVAGITISMSWLVPVIAVLYVFSLAEDRFPYEVPGQTTSAYWIAGVIGAGCFFLSLLAHEIGHALVARREGIGVQGISLWLLGGVAKLEREADTAGAELRIAGVGPLTSAGVGVAFLFLNQALSTGVGLTELYAEVFGWLAFINLLLAAFNLLPGAPLDGGRVLAALLWMQNRDQTRSQAMAARVGQALGAGLLAVGVLILFGDGNGYGIMLLLVGGYIFASARSELRATPALGLLRGVRVGEVMDPGPPVLADWMLVQDLVATAQHYAPHTNFPVRSIDGRITGLITADAVRASDPRLWTSLRLIDLAFPLARVATATTEESVLSMVQRTKAGATDKVLVVAPDGQVAGISGPDAAPRALAIAQARQEQLEPIQVLPPPAPPASWPTADRR